MDRPQVRRGRAAVDAEAERSHAFRALADRHQFEAYQLANAILANHAEAQDAVHDAFVKAWEAWPSLRDRARFEPWFKRILVNTCRNRLRQAKRREASDVTTQPGLAVPDASRQVHAKMQVEAALARLKPDDRVVLALRYYRDLRIEDIANLLDVPVPTAKSRVQAAQGRLRRALERASEG